MSSAVSNPDPGSAVGVLTGASSGIAHALAPGLTARITRYLMAAALARVIGLGLLWAARSQRQGLKEEAPAA